MRTFTKVAGAVLLTASTIVGTASVAGWQDIEVEHHNIDYKIFPADIAFHGEHYDSTDPLLLRAGARFKRFEAVEEADLHAYQTRAGHVSAGSESLNRAKTHPFCYPWD